ncbi:hypothetical protein ABL78_0957 [Leptomonas seymouri]|uniref:Uncharacterized protein n=1 Tax=Leptomonas seymouri TaxID=5684 RepID=A0A0N1IB83_LEPSE|nr:hypothetical protein ABL78_0957 [Leptomonas seymouri]|eukprot:KPI89885.1 hypothetical protein ABL78_0957 [Leptomonas seymouri]
MQVLPQILSDRRQRLRVHEETVVQDATQRMNVAVQQLFACAAQLRQTSDVIEGSVLVLGVPTAHVLLSQLGHAMEAIQTVMDAWRTTSAAQVEHITQYRQFTVSMDQAYNTMREHRDTAERELRALRSERDRKDASFDKAVDYVQQVLTEHTKWQEAYGHNTLQWPVVDACEAAMTALHTARVTATKETNPKAKSSDAELDCGGARSLALAHASPGASKALPLPRREWAAASIDSNEGKSDVLRHRSASASTWRVSTTPSVRFSYVPPAEEVRLLQEVLAMGTGSTTLMRDIQDERARLITRQAVVRAECAKVAAALHSMRAELSALRQCLTHLLGGSGPFTPMLDDLVRFIQIRIDSEVAKRLTSPPGSIYNTAHGSPDDSYIEATKAGDSLHRLVDVEGTLGWLAGA